MDRKADRRIKIRRAADGKRTDRVKKAERERMLRLRNQDKTVEKIALELGRSERTVSKQLEKAQIGKTSPVLPTARDVIMKDALQKHFNDLLDLLSRLEGQVNEINEKRPLGILRDGAWWIESSGLESGSYGGDKGPEGICKWEGKDGRMTKFWLDVEEDRLFKYLRQHLEGESIWSLYEKWKESFRQALEIFDYWERKGIDGDNESVVRMLTQIAECYDNLMEETVRVQQKQVLPGKCDCCPD